MNIRICLHCLTPAILLACSFAPVCAQEQKREVRIVDGTCDPQSPIEVGGQLFVIEEIRNQKLLVSWEGNVTAKNVSQKRILALVTELDLGSSYAGPIMQLHYRDDRFFSSDLLEPDQLEELAHEDATMKFSGDYRQSVPATPPEDPIAKVQVLYVQFEDGSTFRALGPDTLHQNRVASLWALKQLNRVLSSAGKDGFEASLREVPDYNKQLGVLRTISEVLQTGGVDKAADRMQAMLRLAAERRTLM